MNGEEKEKGHKFEFMAPIFLILPIGVKPLPRVWRRTPSTIANPKVTAYPSAWDGYPPIKT